MRATSRTNRSAKGGARSSPHYGGEGVLIHPPHQGVCGRHGTEDQGVTPGELPGSSGGTEGSDSISASETRSSALEVVGRLGSTGGAAKVAPPEAWRPSGSGKPAGEDGRGETGSEMSKAGEEESSLSERPGHHRPRRLADWINPTGARKVHSLIDKVYKRKNLEIAWERVRANHGAGGIDGESIEAFGEGLEERLARLHEERRTDSYAPQPVRQARIPKAETPGEWRTLGIPTIYDRVCQQALLNRLAPIFEPVFDDANFGYRRGRSTKDALGKVWKEIQSGREWIVDADLKDFFGSVDHEKLLALVAQRVSDGRVLRLIEAMLTAGSYGAGRLFPSERGTPQGGVASPLLSNILLTPFDQEMRRKGYQLTRFADDWVITCKSVAEARAALAAATRILERLGVRLNPQKTRIVHIQQGFDFLGYRIVRTSGKSKIPCGMIQRWNPKGLIAYPTRKSIRRYRDRVRMLTRRSAQRKTSALIEELNPTLRGWAEYYKRAHVRTLFHKLDGWIVRRIWSHRFHRWRTRGWLQLPRVQLYEEFGLVNLISLIPSLGSHSRSRVSS